MFRARSMSFLGLFGLTYSAYRPDININLDGKAFQSNNTRWIQMTCLSNKITIGCTAEFLTNQKSYDHLRSVKNQCYHSGGSCTEQLCTCYDDCKQFTLNITTLSEYSKTTFGCTVIVEVDNLKYQATTVIKPVQNDFELFKTEIIPLFVNNSVKETTTHPPSEENSLIERFVLVIAIGTVIICTLSIITVAILIVKCCRRKSKKETRGNISCISYPVTKSHTEHSADVKQSRFPKPQSREGKDRFNSFELESNTDSGLSYTSNLNHRYSQLVADSSRFRVRNQKSKEGKDRLNSFEMESNTDSGFSSVSNIMPHCLPMDSDRSRFSVPKQKWKEGKDRFNSIEMESSTDSEFCSVSNIWNSNIQLDSGHLFSIDEDVYQERETSQYSHSNPYMMSESTSRNTQSPYSSSSSSVEIKSLVDRDSISGPWSRPGSRTVIYLSESDD